MGALWQWLQMRWRHLLDLCWTACYSSDLMQRVFGISRTGGIADITLVARLAYAVWRNITETESQQENGNAEDCAKETGIYALNGTLSLEGCWTL